MTNYHDFIHSVYQIAQTAAHANIAHLNTEDAVFQKNIITIRGRETVNFGSCSYLGLEFDERLKQGAIAAIRNFGTQFSSSRAYVSLGLYKELEDLFKQMFLGAHTLVVPTTTLGHLAAIPVLVEDSDCVIIDHQVHSSVQGAVNMLKARGIFVDMIRHNNMEMLEQKIIDLRSKYRKIWYMADGIYSMYGDAAPIKEIHALLDKYAQFHFYVDDAHGMSCYGKNGAGFVMSAAPMHPKQVLAVGLAKAFATGGAVLVFANFKDYSLVRSCGGPLITSGPMQPAALGAAVASAKIHLTDEIYELQSDLHEKIKFTNLMLNKYSLPVINPTDSPVFFVGTSLPKVANSLLEKMVADGNYLNLGIYPAVPLKNTGVRFTITRLHSFMQIESMVANMAVNFERTLAEQQVSRSKIYKAFKMDTAEETKALTKVQDVLQQNGLQLETFKTIAEINKKEWNTYFEGRGTFDYDGLQFLENAFSQNTETVNNWCFDYLLVRDTFGHLVLATFFTTSRTKDDMLAAKEISQNIEELRATAGQEFLSSKSVVMGSMLTEGQHLYLDQNHPNAQGALSMMIDFAAHLQEEYEANAIMFRDFTTEDSVLDKYFVDNGFVKTALPQSNVIQDFSWDTPQSWLENLSAKSRRHVRGTILKETNQYKVEIVENATEAQIAHWYDLYLQVKNGSLALNTFALPYKLFQNIATAPGWEILSLSLKNEEKPVAVIFNFKSGATYSAMFIGINYSAQSGYNGYRQALYQTILRAKKLGMQTLRLGFTADFEKARLGATAISAHAYVQIKDGYNMSVIANINKSAVAVKKH